MGADTPRVKKLAGRVARLARKTAAFTRAEESRAYALAWRTAEARLLAPLATAPEPLPSRAMEWPARRALLIVNSKSGPKRDSLLRVRDIVDLLLAYNIRADVRVKLSKSQARREARLAAEAGYPLVIAAGGDGTVEAVATGLLGSKTALGVIPLGTYNNVATCLGIPPELAAACALIAAGTPRAIDAGQVEVDRGKGRKKRRVFFETAAVGLGAALTSVGQDAEKGRWARAGRALPVVIGMPPTSTQIRLDGAAPHWADTLLVTVSNAPRGGAGLQLAPEARMDDGLLDVCIYDRLQQADLATRLVALKTGGIVNDPAVRRTRAISVMIRSAQPLPVAADSKLVGVTPARFTILPGAMLAVVGPGPGLAHPAPSILQHVTAELAAATQDGTAAAAPEGPMLQLAAPAGWKPSPGLMRAGLLAVPVAITLIVRALSRQRR